MWAWSEEFWDYLLMWFVLSSRGRSQEWHCKVGGHLLASALLAIRDTFRPEHKETKIWAAVQTMWRTLCRTLRQTAAWFCFLEDFLTSLWKAGGPGAHGAGEVTSDGFPEPPASLWLLLLFLTACVHFFFLSGDLVDLPAAPRRSPLRLLRFTLELTGKCKLRRALDKRAFWWRMKSRCDF